MTQRIFEYIEERPTDAGVDMGLDMLDEADRRTVQDREAAASVVTRALRYYGRDIGPCPVQDPEATKAWSLAAAKALDEEEL